MHCPCCYRFEDLSIISVGDVIEYSIYTIDHDDHYRFKESIEPEKKDYLKCGHCGYEARVSLNKYRGSFKLDNPPLIKYYVIVNAEQYYSGAYHIVLGTIENKTNCIPVFDGNADDYNYDKYWAVLDEGNMFLVHISTDTSAYCKDEFQAILEKDPKSLIGKIVAAGKSFYHLREDMSVTEVWEMEHNEVS